MFARLLSRRAPACLGLAGGLLGCSPAAPASSLSAADVDSSLPMYAKQSELPRLPLPTLEDTLRRYLAAIEPLSLPPAQLEATRALVAEQLKPGSELRALQAKLEAFDAARSSVSFVSDAWEAMYLEGRWPLLINSNPGSVSTCKAFMQGDGATSQVARAARLIASAVAFHTEVEAGTIAPDQFRGVPLDMRQYSRLFSMCRVPRAGRDELRKSRGSKHVVVLRGDTFWEVAVVDDAGAPLSVSAIEQSLRRVVEATPAPRAERPAPSLAALTSADRDSWAAARRELEAASEQNVASFGVVESALFHVVLDQVDLGVAPGADPAAGTQTEAAARLALCGEPRLAPRYLDKSFTIAVSADGVPMWNLEHSWGDGIVMTRMGVEVLSRIRKQNYHAATPSAAASPPPRRLEWRVPASSAREVEACADCIDAASANLDLRHLRFSAYGADALKSWKTSPDGVVQAALQLAFFKTAGRIGATYESATTARFDGGRTETIRSATSAAAAWVASATEGRPLAEQAAALRASAKAHSAVAREAADGKGFDRHLYALKQLASRGGGALPAFFADPSFEHLAGNELSTSTLTIWSTWQSCFGPVHPSGYGVMYHTPKDELRFCVTAFKPSSAARFADELDAALRHVARVLEAEAAEAK